jgi:FtsP/CotA-like multicopper oxidase with cupredoxin domain
MRAIAKILMILPMLAVTAANTWAQKPALTGCPPRPNPGSIVMNPQTLVSQNGTLSADFTFNTIVNSGGYILYCYDYTSTVESPTLQLDPGDTLILNLTNGLPPAPKGGHSMDMKGELIGPPEVGCTGGMITASSTNIHFHGLNIPPVCHQDDVINTLLQSGDVFQYKFQIPANEPPGMYWYHPHAHGFATLQVNGGAAGAIIINGMEKFRPEVSGLPERILMIRQQFLNAASWLPGPNVLTLNFQPADPPLQLAPQIIMKPNAQEFWRVANASTQAFLTLQVDFGLTPQALQIVAFDGRPLPHTATTNTILLPPAGRVEFIVTGPPPNQPASFVTTGYNTGAVGNPNTFQELAEILTSNDASTDLPRMPAATPATKPQRFEGLMNAPVTTARTLYFSETTAGTNGPTNYYITVSGQRPHLFAGGEPPAIVTQVGAVEDWTIENHAQEAHVFHIHQIHFAVLELNGVAQTNPQMRDTYVVPGWNGSGPYPSIKVRMDFRDPEIAGTFVYHCHILDHEDGGMMAKIQVNPAK